MLLGAVAVCPCGMARDRRYVQVMTEHRVRHVPIIKDGKLSGMISIGDVVKARIAHLEFERDQLGNYLYQT